MGSVSSPSNLAERQEINYEPVSERTTHVVMSYCVALRHTKSRHTTILFNTIQILTQLLHEEQGVQEQLFPAHAPHPLQAQQEEEEDHRRRATGNQLPGRILKTSLLFLPMKYIENFLNTLTS